MSYKVLLIGVSDYEKLPPLRAPAEEVKLLREVMISPAASPVGTEDLLLLVDPTLAQVQYALFDVLAGADTGDTVVIYFAGHSKIRRGELQLLFSDADPAGSGLGGLSASTISAALEGTRASTVLVVLNTSYAGDFQLPDSPRIKDSQTTYYFIGSVGPTEPARDDNLFAGALADALRPSMSFGSKPDPQKLFTSISERLAIVGSRPFYAFRGAKSRTEELPTPKGEHRTIFLSYAHKDERWLNKLRPHLESLTRDVAQITYWDDRKIQPGEDWRREIRSRLAASRAAVLLVSADFLASQFIRNDELPTLLSQAEGRRTRLFCLIIRPCRFDRVAVLSRFQAVNSPDKTLSEMPLPEQERTFLRLTDQLEQAMK